MKLNYLLGTALLLSSAVSFSQERVTLIESFTSSTCIPCNAANVALETLFNDAANTDKLTSIKYQVDWPSPGDPYFTSEVNSRRAYYNVSSVPDSHLDGGSGFDPTILTQSMINGALAQPPKCKINAYYNLTAPNTINVFVDVIAYEDFPGGTTCHIGIVEHTTTNNVSTNGETEFYNVCKKMLPGSAGTIMSGIDSSDTAHIEQSYAAAGSYVLPPDAGSPIDFATEHSIEDFNDLGVVVWVQRITTKEVFQSAWAVYGVTGLEENESTIASAKIYPNPAQNNAAIAFQNAVVQDIDIKVFNSMGQTVHERKLTDVPVGREVEDINTEDFANGIYMVHISSPTGNVSRKLSIQK